MAAETFARVQVGHGGAEVARENLGVARQRIGRRADAQDIDGPAAGADADHQSGIPSLACWACLLSTANCAAEHRGENFVW